VLSPWLRRVSFAVVMALGLGGAWAKALDGSPDAIGQPSAGPKVPLGQTVGDEHAVSDPVFFASEKYRGDTAVAWSGQTGLVVWINRDLGYPIILGARIDADGTLLDPGSRLIHDFLAFPGLAPADERPSAFPSENLIIPGSTTLSMAWNGEYYILVWLESRTEDFYASEVYGTRITADGEVLDPAGFQISFSGISSFEPHVACGTANCLVTWATGRQFNPDRSLFGMRIDGSTLLDAAPIPLGVNQEPNVSSSVAWSLDQYFFAWRDGRGGIYGTRLTAGGDVLDGDGVRLSDQISASAPGIAGAPDGQFLVAYTDGAGVRARRIGADGTRQDAADLVVASGSTLERSPVVAWDGGAYAILWTTSLYQGPYIARVDPLGNLLQAEPFPVTTSPDRYEHDPSIASRGDGLVLSWRDEKGSEGARICAARMDSSGNVFDHPAPVVSLTANAQRNPSAAWDGVNHLVVWEDYRSDHSDIYAARVTPDGDFLDGSGILVSGAGFDQTHPFAAWTGRNHVVAWSDARRGGPVGQVFAARVGDAGQVLDPDGIEISQVNGFAIGVAGGVDEALIVWVGGDGIYCTALSADGIVGRTTTISLERSIYPGGVAGNGGSYFVAWQSAQRSAVYGARILRGGKLAAHAVSRISPVGQNVNPSVAANGTGYLVAWTVIDPNDFSTDIDAARVSKAGKLLDAVPIVLAHSDSESLERPVIGWDGFDSTVVWKQTIGAQVSFYGRKVSVGGVVDPSHETGTRLATMSIGGTSDLHARVQSDAAGRLSLFYHRTTFLPPTRGDRVFLRFLDECADPQEVCDIEGVAPAPNAIFAPTAAPPLFWWNPGSAHRFRLEFSATPEFTHVLASQKTLTLMTSYVPTAGKWKSIRGLSGAGAPIYWRVAGVNGSGTSVASAVQSFSISPP